ncbi:MAG: winged helix-turn-helix transcriptional regulator [Calditrichaeota bacterium]|nr:winged helix-turn-helix transcriptional regulator [Candidatus Cloacimonadota bacterium]MCB1047611.1 winged helix-turn-helix transcriptional regulator [Calditrichota bacterium]MCB9472513.1 winged helix-turn-helix transcriptional regulator [Candidatus Delongbacteria bacterium]
MLDTPTTQHLGQQLARALAPRWGVAVLAALSRSGGERVFRLHRLLGANPGTLRKSLESCRQRGWILPNPGHGHPLRPEWLLDPDCMELARKAAELTAELEALGQSELLAAKWALPVLREVGQGADRFRDIREELGLTDRALALALDLLVTRGLLIRELHEGHPPGSRYRCDPVSRELLEKLELFVIELGARTLED